MSGSNTAKVLEDRLKLLKAFQEALRERVRASITEYEELLLSTVDRSTIVFERLLNEGMEVAEEQLALPLAISIGFSIQDESFDDEGRVVQPSCIASHKAILKPIVDQLVDEFPTLNRDLWICLSPQWVKAPIAVTKILTVDELVLLAKNNSLHADKGVDHVFLM